MKIQIPTGSVQKTLKDQAIHPKLRSQVVFCDGGNTIFTITTDHSVIITELLMFHISTAFLSVK